MNTKSILLNATLATATVLAVSPAEAFTLSRGSTLTLSGLGSVRESSGTPPSSATLTFDDKKVEGKRFQIGATGDFAKIFGNHSKSDNNDTIADLFLQFTDSHDGAGNAIYKFDDQMSFIDFGKEKYEDGTNVERGTLVFNLNRGQFTRTEESPFGLKTVSYDTLPLTGTFVFTPNNSAESSSAFAVGNAEVSYTHDPDNGGFDITLAVVGKDSPAETIPEPGALLGLAATFGFLPFVRRKKETVA